jgi:hypothetical protein
LKVGALLEAYPELENVLIELAPAFAKLRNPVLRRTVAKVTTLRQAARVGGLSLGDMIRSLRSAAGFQEEWREDGGDESEQIRPAWLDSVRVTEVYDAREEIEAGGQPLPTVLAALKRLKPGEGYALVTPFTPAPMIDKARELGFQAWSEQQGSEEFRTTFRRSAS